MKDIINMANRFADRADFLMVYIAEAHAADEWPVGDPVVANQPKRLKERLSLANSFVSEYSIDKEPLLHMVVDNLSDMSPHESDPADRAYAFWPTRFYVVDSCGKISYKANPNQTHEYKLDDLATFLEGVVGQPVLPEAAQLL